jgi:predicted DsbA family dithiol-disulfide isomerase
MVDVAAGTLLIYSDIACPWATLALAGLWEARERLGLADRVRFDHRAFPLELFNSRPHPRAGLDAEIPVIGALAPDFTWSVWRRRPEEYPVTTLLPLEAVQAAKEQSVAASEQLDLALRRAFFSDSRCISLRSEIEQAAKACADLDLTALMDALDEGRARRAVIDQWRAADTDDRIKGSPHVFLPDGSDSHNPGVAMHMQGEHGRGFPVIDSFDGSVYGDLIKRAAR